MKIRWMIAPATALLALTLALTACGGGDDKTASSSPSATATNSTAAATDTSGASATPKATATTKQTSTPKATATSAEVTDAPEGTIPDESTPDIDECALVNPDDLGLLANDSFDAGELADDTCTFTGSGGVVVQIGTYDLDGQAKELFESSATIFGDDILDSPGDEAYYDTDLGLSILKGSIELDIYVDDPDSTRDRDSAFAVSDVAVPGLP